MIIENLLKFSLFLMFVTTSWSKEAVFPGKPRFYSYKQALQECDRLGLQKPESDSNGRTATMNRMGGESPVTGEMMDPATRAFVEEARGVVLDVGGCYGSVMRRVMQSKPNIEYHLNDLNMNHLFVAASQLRQEGLDGQSVSFIHGDITQEWNIWPQYDAIFVGRVLHFFNPVQMSMALNNLHKLLKPGGKIYVVAITPYVDGYKPFIAEYQKRVKRGDEYPGYVPSLRPYLNPKLPGLEEKASTALGSFMFLDATVLRREFEKVGFTVIKCEEVPLGYTAPGWQLDKRENVVLEGCKQSKEKGEHAHTLNRDYRSNKKPMWQRAKL